MYEFTDREVTNPLTYYLVENSDGTVTLTPAPGTVSAKGTPINKATMEAMQKDIYDSLYPVGAIVMSGLDDDYSDYLGFEWERTLQGVAPVGYSEDDTDYSTVGNIGGEKTKTLTVSNMPEHTHTFTGTASSHTHTVSAIYGSAESNGSLLSGASYDAGTAQTRTTSSVSITPKGTISSTGDNAAFDIRGPYEVVAFWKRIA